MSMCPSHDFFFAFFFAPLEKNFFPRPNKDFFGPALFASAFRCFSFFFACSAFSFSALSYSKRSSWLIAATFDSFSTFSRF